MLAVAGVKGRVAVDRHHVELESDFGLHFPHDLESAGAQTAPGGGVEDEQCYGYRPRVVVASATRCTASPYEAMRRLVS
jgi:hypothetical protein